MGPTSPGVIVARNPNSAIAAKRQTTATTPRSQPGRYFVPHADWMRYRRSITARSPAACLGSVNLNERGGGDQGQRP